MFVELCWNTIFSFSKQLLTVSSIGTVITETKLEIKNSGTHPIVVIVLSILIFDYLNLGTYKFETGVSRLT